MNEATARRPSRTRLIIGSAAALLVAAAILVMFVLPAEFGIDPLGTGRLTGLGRLSQTGMTAEQERGAKRKGVLALSDAAVGSDRWEVELQPYEAVEFKYTLAKGAPMLFGWQAGGKLRYDMHAHPFEGGEALTESYGVGDAERMQGYYVAPFAGIHGWYWQNRSLEPVTLTLNAAGAFTASSIFGATGEQKRTIGPAAAPAPEGATDPLSKQRNVG